MFIRNREVPTWLNHWRSAQSQQPAKLSMTQKKQDWRFRLFYTAKTSTAPSIHHQTKYHLTSPPAFLQQSPQNHAFSSSVSLAILRASSPQIDLSPLCKFLLCFSWTSCTTTFSIRSVPFLPRFPLWLPPQVCLVPHLFPLPHHPP